MDFLTEEELFELQHQDELETLNELDSADPDEYDFDPFSYAMKKHSSSSKNENNNDIKSREIPVLKDNLPKEKKESSKHSENNENCSINHSVSNEDCDKTEEKENSFGGIIEPIKNTGKDVLEISSSPLKHVENSEYYTSVIPRRLFIDESMCTEDNACSDESDGDLECSESLISQSGKRKFSKLSDNEDESLLEVPGKKQCHSLENSPKLQPSGSTCIADKPISSFTKDKLPLTRSDGRRIYFCVNEENDEKNIVPSFSQRTSTLLSTPIEELKSQYFIMEENTLKSCEMQASENDNLQMDTTEDLIEERNMESLLWVEKYRPLSYMHLLSEEGINRTLLHWLKLWDKVVFGREKKRKKKNTEPQKEKKFQKTYGELIEDLDEYGRPHHKVAFLSGPPGLGKTTLAVIIAKQAGYNVVELNASDDRNPEAFRTQLEAATQMKSVLQQDKRPNCLILDEIDGAPAPSINVLLSFIKSTGITKGKRKKGDIPLLMRPVICICNDPYSAALKPLRQLALVLNFPPTTSSRLTARLNEVSLKEGLIAEMAALTLLCEKTSNDIRSCLSTLQFIHRKQKELKVHDLKGLHIGQKDVQKSLFAVWQDIFHAKNPNSFNAIHHTVQAFGDYDKVYIGVLENYLNIKFKRNLDAVWEGPEWLCFADIIQQQIAQNQLFFLLPYLPYPAVAFHLLYAQNTFPHISYPSAYYEHTVKRAQLSNTLSSMMKEMVSNLKTFLNPTILLLDMFPFLLEIIKPTLRPVNTQLYSQQEKNELQRVIELMLAFNLNYRQERTPEGIYNYVLDPNIEELIKLGNLKAKRMLTYSAKQMIAREVEMEQMRKGDNTTDVKEEKVKKESDTKRLLEPKSAQKTEIEAEKPMLDFFGRRITVPENSKTAVKGDPKEEVWIRFKEGYSNAVRRNVYIKDLL